ncbi:MAG TPA: DUF4398 domain-containing protein [Polyangiaceae bacterium]|jgi:hypothetical protein|nr:DUF4398 domain-containing protein [Polyangiaceae bacterium]
MKLSLIVVGALLAGCASAAPAPHDSLASAMDTVRSATALGPSGEAEDRMQRAKSEIDRAIGLMHEGKNEEAQRLLTRANVDAELALELGRENVMMRRARDAKAVVESARQGE